MVLCDTFSIFSVLHTSLARLLSQTLHIKSTSDLSNAFENSVMVEKEELETRE